MEAYILKENIYGVLTEQSDHLIFTSKFRTITIDPTISTQSLYFSDGSYIKVDPTRSLITRYSAKTKIQESTSLSNGFSTAWDVPAHITAVLEDYYSFSESPHQPLPPTEDCYDGEVLVVCDNALLHTYEELNLKYMFTKNQALSANSNCSAERSNLNRGYNGHSSLFRCSLGTGMALVGSGLAVLGACVVEPTKLMCLSAGTLYAGAIVQYSDSQVSCQISYKVAFDEWKNCTENNPDNGSGGGSAGSICTERNHYEVCTGGGCTRWTEINVVAC
ncbi:hypothetical protein [Pseudoalteromonas ulvae]|uniref:hypothetical protein n=1 Tax=Pseudoalteromonas ulvae TaxID=107327 RepID=UPI0011249980|nr:hypothetical protein [Pseudoalteromonas ulvae]